jgi:hypothetical protein
MIVQLPNSYHSKLRFMCGSNRKDFSPHRGGEFQALAFNELLEEGQRSSPLVSVPDESGRSR